MSLVSSNGGPAPVRREPVSDPIHALDTGRFEQMFRVANVMAKSGIMPQSLTHTGKAQSLEELPEGVIQARAFAIVNQATRWNMDPFAVMSCTSFVHGRLMYEGKLVAAVLDAKLGVVLDFVWDDKQGDAAGITVEGRFPDGRVRKITGTVAEWKTSGAGSPWGSPAKNRKMLAYRGTREWARLWAPGVLLGVYTPDEMDELEDQARDTRRIRQIAPPPPAIEHQPSPAVEARVHAPASAQSRTEPVKEEPKQEEGHGDRPRKKAPPPASDEQEINWPAQLESFENAVGSSESEEELDEHLQQVGDQFIDSPPDIQAAVRKAETEARNRLARQAA